MTQCRYRPDEKPRGRDHELPSDAALRDEPARGSRVPDAAKQAGHRLSPGDDIQRDRTRWVLIR